MAWDFDIRRFANRVAVDHDQLTRAVAVRLLHILTEESPRDTGTYANNHHVSFNSPDVRYKIADKGNQQEVINFFGGNQEAKVYAQPRFNTVYVQNNLPYAEYLENGTDKMAAQNIYSISIQKLKAEYSV